jgi:diguanylate cyclase (GGDEF)-like protein
MYDFARVGGRATLATVMRDVLLRRFLPIESLHWPGIALWHVGERAGRDARDAVIRARVTAIAAVFAVLTVAWIGVDLTLLEHGLAIRLAVGRIVAGLAFAALVILGVRRPATHSLALLFAIPLAFYAYALALPWDGHMGADGLALATTYLYLPFVVVGGVAIFPLTLAECAALAVPWLFAAAVAGATTNPAGHTLSLGLLWLLALIAGVAGIAAASQLQFLLALVVQASRDALTGALNRRVGIELLEAQIAGAQRRDAPLSVALIDLDRFKAINDGFGHAAGDRTLAAAVAAMMRVSRRQDGVIRWGGEEFVLVLPHTDLDGARRTVERLAIHGLGLRPDGAPQTASVGIAELHADQAADSTALVALADERMYQAKRTGRNRVAGPDGAIAVLPVPAATAAPVQSRAAQAAE